MRNSALSKSRMLAAPSWRRVFFVRLVGAFLVVVGLVIRDAACPVLGVLLVGRLTGSLAGVGGFSFVARLEFWILREPPRRLPSRFPALAARRFVAWCGGRGRDVSLSFFRQRGSFKFSLASSLPVSAFL